MPNPYKIGDKVKLSRNQIKKENNRDLQNALLGRRRLEYDEIYVVTRITDAEKFVIDGKNVQGNFYIRFFELLGTKSVGFIIE